MKQEAEEIALDRGPKRLFKIISNNCILEKEKTTYYLNGVVLKTEGVRPNESEYLGDEVIYKFYHSLFGEENRNLVFLCGAGTSVYCGDGSNSGKTRNELWESCQSEIGEIIEQYKNDAQLKSFDNEIEGFLSRAFLLQKVYDTPCDAIKRIEKKIQGACRLTLGDNSPHLEMLNKVISRKVSNPRVKIFTTNYDTLFEQAASKGAFVVVDGFSYSHPRYFSGRFFDVDFVNRNKTRLKNEDNFIPKVFHLYKLHGSLWWKRDNEQIVQEKDAENPLIVYPASDKFELSYDQPYFEMMSRFQSALRDEDLMLVVIGFGFKDKHIQNVIIEAVRQNSNFQLVIIDYGVAGGINVSLYKELGLLKAGKGEVKPIKNVTILQGSFADFAERYPMNKTYDVSLKDE